MKTPPARAPIKNGPGGPGAANLGRFSSDVSGARKCRKQRVYPGKAGWFPRFRARTGRDSPCTTLGRPLVGSSGLSKARPIRANAWASPARAAALLKKEPAIGEGSQSREKLGK